MTPILGLCSNWIDTNIYEFLKKTGTSAFLLLVYENVKLVKRGYFN